MNQLDKNSYTLFLNSTDKVSGSNNNANYQVNWDDFLPRDIDNYKVVFSFQTAGGYYRDNFSQFKNITVAPAPVQCTYQTSAIIYNPITNSTSLLISVLNNGPLLLNNYVSTGGKRFFNYSTSQCCW